MSTVTNELQLPCSIAEALDKYDILRLKQVHVNDDMKREAVKYEMECLEPCIRSYLAAPSSQQFLTQLHTVNAELWRLCDQIRQPGLDSKQRTLLCSTILEFNDARVRIKGKINRVFVSKLREIKSYAARQLVLLGHFGMGDHITMVGAVRYLSLFFDTVTIVARPREVVNLRQMYADDPSILFMEVEGDADISPQYRPQRDLSVLQGLASKGYSVMTCGFHRLQPAESLHFQSPLLVEDLSHLQTAFACEDGCVAKWQTAPLESNLTSFYKVFYAHLGLCYNKVRFPWTFVPRDLQREKLRMQEALSHCVGQPYAFVHDEGYERLHIEKHTNLPLVRPAKGKAGRGGGGDLLDYGMLIESATEIYVLDAAFFCLTAALLRPTARNKVVYVREEFYDVLGYLRPGESDSWTVKLLAREMGNITHFPHLADETDKTSDKPALPRGWQ